MSFDEPRAVWISGQLVPWREADRQARAETLHNGVWEGIRCYDTDLGPAVFRLDEHVDRFFQSAERYGIAIPFSRREIAAAVCQTVGANGFRAAYIRPAAYLAGRVETAVVAWPWPDGARTMPSTPGTFFAVRAGVVAAAVDAERVSTVTHDAILTIARDLGYGVEAVRAPRAEIDLADEAFVVNDMSELEPLRVGPVTRAIQNAFANATSGRSTHYGPWLHLVDDCMLAGAYNAVSFI